MPGIILPFEVTKDMCFMKSKAQYSCAEEPQEKLCQLQKVASLGSLTALEGILSGGSYVIFIVVVNMMVHKCMRNGRMFSDPKCCHLKMVSTVPVSRYCLNYFCCPL